jgi:hypothetical protein
MASQRNPEGKSEAGPGARVGVTRRTGGTVKRPSIPVGGGTRGRSVTMTGVGTEDKNPPESGRARQDAARGTVHGQPRSGYNDGDNIRR